MERPRVNTKVERGSTFTFTRDFSISLTHIKKLTNQRVYQELVYRNRPFKEMI